MMTVRSPYIGPGLWVSITHRFGPRMPEWFMAGHMTLFGLALLMSDGLFQQPTWSGFAGILPWALPAAIQAWMGWIMMVAGLARFGGLIVNGARKRVTPMIRQVSAGVGCLLWFGIVHGFASSDILSTWAAIYPLFGVNELFNIYRAAHNQGETRNGKAV